MAQSVTLSTAGTAVIVLNPVAKSTTVLLSATNGSSNATISVEMSLDDPTIIGGPAATWATLSSASAMASSAVTTLVYTVLSPIAQVRLNSTLNSSLPSFNLKALQSVTA